MGAVHPNEDQNGNVDLIWFRVIHVFSFILNGGARAGI